MEGGLEGWRDRRHHPRVDYRHLLRVRVRVCERERERVSVCVSVCGGERDHPRVGYWRD